MWHNNNMANTYQQDITNQALFAPSRDLAVPRSAMVESVSTTGFNPTITPRDVYSADNIAYASSNQPAPDYSDPFKLRDYYLNTPDVLAARNNLTAVNAELIKAQQTARAQQQAIQDNPMAMNVIRGNQATAGAQANLTLQALAENKLAAQSAVDALTNEANAKYQIAQEERGKLQNLITQTGGKAGISYTDTFEQALSKATNYQEKQAKEAEEKAKKEAEGAYKKQLQATAIELGIGTKTKKGGTMSVKDLEKAISKSKKLDKDKQDELNNLKLQAERVSIANTKSLISERGKKTGSLDYSTDNKTIATLVEQAYNAGEDWGTIVSDLDKIYRSQGKSIDLKSGSFVDNYLKWITGNSKNNPLKDTESK